MIENSVILYDRATTRLMEHRYNILFLSDLKKRNYFKDVLIEKNLLEINDFEKKLLRNKFNSLNPESNNFLASEIFKLVSIN